MTINKSVTRSGQNGSRRVEDGSRTMDPAKTIVPIGLLSSRSLGRLGAVTTH